MKHLIDNKTRAVAYVITIVLLFGMTGCATNGADSSDSLNANGYTSREIITGRYIPSALSNIKSGGEIDASPITPHDSTELPLDKLEGYWVHERYADSSDEGSSNADDSAAFDVTDGVIAFNEKHFECLPKSFDLRPYSPVRELITKGFGYGAADFEEVAENGELFEQVNFITSISPYGGIGFICTTDGKTLALGLLGDGSKMEEYGAITDDEENALNECTFTEIDYDMSFDGVRLTLSYGDARATYVRQASSLHQMHSARFLFGEPLYEDGSIIKLLEFTPKSLTDDGYVFDCDLEEFLPSRSVSEEFAVKTPSGAMLEVKLVNPYEKPVPIGYTEICWYQYDGNKNDSITVGIPSQYEWSHSSQSFGVTPYADVYNYYELPYAMTKDSLSYRAGYIGPIRLITHYGEGFDTGERLLQSEHSSEIRLEFNDNVLCSISIGDPVYLNAGLQDNVAHDDLDDLKPSVYREVTEQRDEILDGLKRAFKDAGLDAAINESTGEVVMDNNVLFAKNSYELGDEGKEYLDGVFSAYASVVLDDKYSPSLKEISFEGNTDSDGDSEYNMRLSELRAQAVMEHCSGILDGKKKAAFDGLAVCRGYGESDLVYDEGGREDMDASRRVAIKFMLNVDDLKSETESQSSDEGASSKASASTRSGGADDGPAPGATQGEADVLKEFQSISGNFSRAWTLYEEPDGDGSVHASVLLLSDDHDYCAYLDLEQKASSDEANGYYTFGKTSVEELGKNNQAITVRHRGDEDRLNIVFNAWKRDDMVSISDPWGGVNNLTAFDDVESAISFYEDVIS